MNKFKHFLLFPFLFLTFVLSGQDIHFSQFYMSPLNLNPALTGVMNCNGRLVVNYRNQWASILKNKAYNTYSVSYDQRIPVGRYDYFGIGGTLWGDKAGSASFSTYTAKLSASYAKMMGGGRNNSNYLVAGAEFGGAQRGIDALALRWGSQFEEGKWNGSLAGENLDNNNFFFMDMSAGLLWFSTWDKTNNFYVGAAYHHLNQANLSFFDDGDEPQYSKYTFHTGAELNLKRNFVLVPGAVVFMQGALFQANTGTNFRFISGDRGSSQSFDLGIWTRLSNRLDGIHADAIILSTRFDYDNFGIGLSYDINVSQLRTATAGNGGFELSGYYKFCGNEKRNVYCPKF